jgi:hypothetical protein
MLLKLISCNVFQREASHCIAHSPHVIDTEFIELGEHIRPENLRGIIQEAIDRTSAGARPYDAILLLFGLCGNAGVGLQARSIPLVMPRAHDCCTILLGSRETFREHFADAPSTPFSSSGYMERGEYFLRIEDGETQVHYGDAYAEYVEKYGEENAKYIWEQMHPLVHTSDNRAVYIEVPEFAHLGYVERFRAKCAEADRTCVELPGDLRLVRKLIQGEWDAEEFLTVQPGRQTQGVYDWTEIIRSQPV